MVSPLIHPSPALQSLNAVIFNNFACRREKSTQNVFDGFLLADSYTWWPYLWFSLLFDP